MLKYLALDFFSQKLNVKSGTSSETSGTNSKIKEFQELTPKLKKSQELNLAAWELTFEHCKPDPYYAKNVSCNKC